MSKNRNQRATFNPTLLLILSTIVLGLLVGLSSMLLSFFFELTEKIFLQFGETVTHPSPINTAPWLRFGSVVVGGMIAAGLWWGIQRYGRPVVGIKKALQGGQMPVKETIINVLTQIFYVGTGGSVGRELAPRQAGVMIAQQWQRLLDCCGWDSLSDDDRHLLLAAAAGAGFAGVYIAPITGMFFSIEMLLKKASLRNVVVSLMMSAIAMLMGSIAKGFKPYYWVNNIHLSLNLLLIGLVLGPLAGILGACFRQAMAKAQANQTQGKGILWQLPLVALATGAVAYYYPNIIGNGRALTQASISSHTLLLSGGLLLLALVKFCLTFATLKTGGSGGTLTPAIASGAALGACLGCLLLLVDPSVAVEQIAVLGAAAFLAASQQAPLMAIFMSFEITHLDYTGLLPLAWVVALSAGVSYLYLEWCARKTAV